MRALLLWREVLLCAGRRLRAGVAEVRYGRLREEAPLLPCSLKVQLQAERGVLTVLARAPPRAAQAQPGGTEGQARARLAPVEGAYVKVYAEVGSVVRLQCMHGPPASDVPYHRGMLRLPCRLPALAAHSTISRPANHLPCLPAMHAFPSAVCC